MLEEIKGDKRIGRRGNDRMEVEEKKKKKIKEGKKWRD